MSPRKIAESEVDAKHYIGNSARLADYVQDPISNDAMLSLVLSGQGGWVCETDEGDLVIRHLLSTNMVYYLFKGEKIITHMGMLRSGVLLFFFLMSHEMSGQKPVSISVGYGRSFFYYEFKDYGKGFVNEQAAHYNFVVEANVLVPLSNRVVIKTGISFTMYQQYFSTPLQWGAYEEPYPIIKFPLLGRYSIPIGKWQFAGSAGVTIGFMPDQYIGEFEAYRYKSGVIDSVATGVVYREYKKFFPLISLDGEIGYRISSKVTAYVKGGLDQGLSDITKYDIRYNAGSGSNDQHAIQTGKGNSSTILLGIRLKILGSAASNRN